MGSMGVVIYSDASVRANPARAGFACVMTDDAGNVMLKAGTSISGIDDILTAQTLGIGFALVLAIKATEPGDAIQVKCDNVHAGLTWHNVICSAMKKADYYSVLPRQQRAIWCILLKDIIQYITDNPRNIQMAWVKGHNNNCFNQEADRLAKKACKK